MANTKTAAQILGAKKKLPPQLAKLTFDDLKTLQKAFGGMTSKPTSTGSLADCCCCCTAVSVKFPNS